MGKVAVKQTFKIIVEDMTNDQIAIIFDELDKMFEMIDWDGDAADGMHPMFVGETVAYGTYTPGKIWGPPEDCYPDDYDVDYNVWDDDVRSFAYQLEQKYAWFHMTDFDYDEDEMDDFWDNCEGFWDIDGDGTLIH